MKDEKELNSISETNDNNITKKEKKIEKKERQTQKEEVIKNYKETEEEKKLKKKQRQKKYTFRKYFYGVGKEFERIAWTSKKNLLTSFVVVIVVVAFFALVFTGVTLGILAI